MFNFLNKLSSHRKAADKIQRIDQQGLNFKNTSAMKAPGPSSEFGEYFGKKGTIKVDEFIADSTRYMSTDLYELERKQAIEKYRFISMLPECEDAIEEIVNESIVQSENEDNVVNLSFTNNDIPPEIREQIIDEFSFIRDELLDFRGQGHYIFRHFYVDGTIFFEKVFDVDNIRDGIQKLNMLDSRFVSAFTVFADEKEEVGNPNEIRRLTDEFFVVRKPKFSNRYYRSEGMYSFPSGTTDSETFEELKIPKELITYVDSGLYHPSREYPLSYLHKALKVANQLTLLEDALLIYRITRAPERRVFYIEVGNLPPNAAESHIQELMRDYRQEKVYDVNSGTIKDKNAVLAMTEDFWLPRRNGTASTEVTTLAGGQNLDQVADLEYFARKIWRALSVPYARRADKENSGVSYNSGRELSLEELKFYKFIIKLRRQFSKVFEDLLATQLITKRIVSSHEINDVMSKIRYVYSNDNYFSEFLRLEVMSAKLDVVNAIDSYEGKYVSKGYIWREVFNFSDEQIAVEVERMNQEEQGNFMGVGSIIPGDGENASTTPPEEDVESEDAPDSPDSPDSPGDIEQG